MKKFKENPNFIPCTPVIGKETLGGYPFRWNITAASAWIEKNMNQVELSTVHVNPPSLGGDSDNQDEEFIPKADLTKPVIVIRMRLEFYRLIDGNHRVANARRLGVKELLAYYLTEWQHRQFLTFEKSNQKYVDYWNGKLKDFEIDGGRWGVVGSLSV